MEKIYKYLWLICLVIGFCGFVVIYYFKPHTPEINSLWEYYYRILIFMTISSSFAFFPNKSKKSYLLLIVPIIIYAAYIGNKLDYVGYRQLMMGIDAGDYYYVLLYLLLYPFIVSCVTFSYRIGGGTSGNCLKLSMVGVLILFSGFLDVMFNIVNPIEIPDVIPYVYYFKAYFGHFPTFPQEIAFCLAHIPLIVATLFLPLDKWINKLFSLEPEYSNNMEAKMKNIA